MGTRTHEQAEGGALVAAGSRVARYVGAAFVAQFATSLTAGILSRSILAGGISEVLVKVSDHVVQMRATIVLELFTSVGIIALTALLYVVLRDQNRAVALVALGLWLAEAVMLAVSTLGVYALLTAERGVCEGGAPAASHYQTLGTLFLGVDQHAGDIAMLFFCVGAFLWYYLLFRSRVVPRALSVWGLLAVPPVLVATLMYLSGSQPRPQLRSLRPLRAVRAGHRPLAPDQGRPPCIDGRGVRMKAIV